MSRADGFLPILSNFSGEGVVSMRRVVRDRFATVRDASAVARVTLHIYPYVLAHWINVWLLEKIAMLLL